MLANFEPGHIRKRGIRIDLERGDIGWSERELAKRWQWSRGKVRRFLLELLSEKERKMVPQNGPQNRNVTSCYRIRNYERFQGNGPQNGPQTDRKRYQKKNVKNEKKKYVETDQPFQLAALLLRKILSNKPDHKKPDLQEWATHIDRMIRLDGRKPERIREVIEWCQDHDFWKTNIRSTRKLRIQFDGLEMQMNNSKGWKDDPEKDDRF